MKLISMTDFCLEILNENPPYNETEMLTKISNYANFLKQPLTLGMFIPVNEEGKVLEEPELYGETTAHLEEWGLQQVKYNKAKEKNLFEGIELKSDTEESWMFKINGKYPFIIRKTMIVESLLIYSTKIELTPSALKQIGL